jgi:hypothetical protein
VGVTAQADPGTAWRTQGEIGRRDFDHDGKASLRL